MTNGTTIALFLLRRAKLLHLEDSLKAVPPSLLSQAETLVELLDGLPLALDQAGAYVEETRCTLSDYLERYTTQRKALLSNRGVISSHHPASVATTFSLAFQHVERVSPAAADLLRVCAFLYAEAIPEEFFIQTGETLSPTLRSLATPLSLDAAIRELRHFSLLHREPEMRTLGIHRLLQAIILDEMDEAEQRSWMEHIIYAMLQVFPHYGDGASYEIKTQARYQRYIPHVLICASAIKKWDINVPEAGELLYQVAISAQFWGDPTQAVSLLLQALHIAEKIFGRDHARVALYLNALAMLLVNVRQYTQAEKYFQQTLAIREKVYGPNHIEVADSLRELAQLLCRQGRYVEAESFAQRARVIEEQAFGSDHYEVAFVLSTLGTIYLRKGDLNQAEQLLQRALGIYSKTVGAKHFFAASCLRNLGYLNFLQGHCTQTMTFYQQALSIYEKNLGPYNSVMGSLINNIGYVYFIQNQYHQAQIFYQRALSIYKKNPKISLYEVASNFIDLGELYMIQGRARLAKHCLQRALAQFGETLSTDQVDHQEITHCLLLIGDRLVALGERMEAQTYYQRARIIGEQVLGLDHPFTMLSSNCLEDLSAG